jgi:hydroxyacylglutathione hydrolase
MASLRIPSSFYRTDLLKYYNKYGRMKSRKSEPPRRTQAMIIKQQMGFRPSPPVDWAVRDGDLIAFGQETLKVIHTPGHTPGGICLYGRNNLFTGDTLFVGAVGRTDLPGGSLETLLQSLKDKIITLPDETVVRPGHDYGDQPTSTIGREKKTNPYLTDF